MRYRLALDVGTASIGLVAYQLDENGEPGDIPYHSVRIFQEPVLPAQNGGVGNPKKAARRQARQQRRQTERKAQRLRRIAHLFPLIGLQIQDIAPDSGQAIHALRAQAANHPIPLADFARVLLKLTKRRGYSGGFKVKKEGEEGQVEGGIRQLNAEMAGKADTLGQYLAQRFEQGQTLKLRDAGLYANRALVEAEFGQLWKVQAAHHSALNGVHQGRPLKAVFRDAILDQRSLKSPAPMVGNCQLEPNLPRAPLAQPAAQAFRIEKQLADLRWGMGKNAPPLSPEQKTVIRSLLRDKEKVTFEAIYKALGQAGCPKPLSRWLNMDRASRPELTGDKTHSALRKLQLLEEWDTLEVSTQAQIVNFLADLGSPDQLNDPDWHRRFHRKVRDGKDAKGQWKYKTEPRQFSQAFIGFINRLVESGKFGRLSQMGFDGGRSGYSIKTLNQLTKLMREEGLDERAAVERAYPRHHEDRPLRTQLPFATKTGNTVVDVALRQLAKEIHKAMAALGGPPAEVIVELARDMALGLKRRGDIEKENDFNRRKRLKVAKELRDHGYPDSEVNIRKYLLWEEQNQQYCPYCDRAIGLGDVVDGNATHIEHILPRSLTRVGRRRDQLVLAHNACNDAKGDRTPWQAWGGEPPKDKHRWTQVEAQAQRFAKKNGLAGKAKLLILKDWDSEVLDDEAIQGFSSRQFQETAWIAKLTAQWLRQTCPKVSVSRGELTAFLRRSWHLETVIPQVRLHSDPPLPVFDIDGGRISQEDFDRYKAHWEGRDWQPGRERTERRIDKRKDHRHHLIDALVIGLTTPPLFQKMAREYKARAERLQAGERVRLNLSVQPPLLDIRKLAVELVAGCNLSHKPDRYPDGALFKDTAYGVMETPDANGGEARKRLVRREKLAGLADDKTSADKARKVLAAIACDNIRTTVLAEFERRLAKGYTSQQALIEPMEHPGYRTPIKKVKMLHGYADGAKRIEHRSRVGVHHKYLLNEGYAYLEMRAEGKGVQTRLVPPVEAMKEKGRKPPEGVGRFYKGDCVCDAKDGKVFLIKQIKAEAGGKLILMPYTEASEVEEMKGQGVLRNVSGKRLLDLQVLPF